MFKMRCRACGSTHTKKNGVRKGVQLYKCQDCGYQFRSGFQVSDDELWTETSAKLIVQNLLISSYFCTFIA